jgi:hypothetical protein
MSGYAVTHVDDIEEMSDGRCPYRPGRTTEALDHLRRAIDISEQVREYAKEDSDLDPIRDEPAFKQLIGD